MLFQPTFQRLTSLRFCTIEIQEAKFIISKNILIDQTFRLFLLRPKWRLSWNNLLNDTNHLNQVTHSNMFTNIVFLNIFD